MHISEFKKEWRKFKLWLEEHGSELLSPSNEFEAARFTTETGVGVVYFNKSGFITSWTGGASEAWDAWKKGKKYQARPRTERKGRGAVRRKILVTALADRDGWNCMYCGCLLDADTATIEHIVPLSRAGYDNKPNMTLACEDCNKAVGSMSAREKFEYALNHRQTAE